MPPTASTATPLQPEATSSAFPQAFFAATHNSYSGGSRGTYTQQLDGGVRCLELDINDENFQQAGDYLVGHGSPGHQVDHAPGNPSSNDMSAWLDLVASWSRAHPGHAPITLVLDSKDDLAHEQSPADGNLCALNSRVGAAFGELLFTAEQLARLGNVWPSVQQLQGRVLVVLSGNETTRKGYLSDQGSTPAVALNSQGWVVEVHQSQTSNSLWYWSGRMGSDGTVTWLRHGQYDTGTSPCVALNDDGVIVEVHQSQSRDTLFSHVGTLGPDGTISWGPSQQLVSGTLPSLQFASPSGLEVVEVHQTDSTRVQLTATVDVAASRLTQVSLQNTTQPRFPTASASAGGRSLSVRTGTDSAGTSNTLLYSTAQVTDGRIRNAQLLFVEFQKGDSTQLANEGLWFYAASASDLDWGGQQRQAGKLVRLWDFDCGDTSVQPPVNFPATNSPAQSCYVTYMQSLGVST